MDRSAVVDLLRAASLIDGHNDLLRELRQGRDPADPTLMTNLPRMAAGGVGGQFWSVYVPRTCRRRALTITHSSGSKSRIDCTHVYPTTPS